MSITREALGRLYDVGTGWAPVDLNTADGATPKRLSMMPGRGVTFLVFCGAGGSEDITFDVQQHTAYTGGTTADLDSGGVAGSTGIDHFWIKSETTLDNDEAWVKVTQSEASEVVVSGSTYGALQKIIAIHVQAGMLAPGYTHVSLNCSVTTSTAQLSSCIYIVHDLRYQRRPDRLFNLLNPGAANV